MLSTVRGAAVVGFMLAALPGVAQEQSRAEEYKLGPDSERKADVPKGLVLKQAFNAGPNSVFPGTERDYWVYVPKQYDGSKPAALMVFQDGGGYVGEGGQWRVPVVFDNLIAKGEMPVTIAVFVNPGVRTAADSPAAGANNRSNRSFEYDSLGNAFSKFLLD
jgi:enterochelin esterase family protein